MPNRLDIQLNTLAGDIRDVLVSHARAIPKTWASMSEGEQRNFIEKAFSAGRRLALEATNVVAHAGYEAVTVTVGKYAEDDKGIKAELRIEDADDEDVVRLRAMRGRRAILIMADATEYLNARGDVRVDLDQPELFDDEEGEDFGNLGDGAEGEEGEEGERPPANPLIGQTIRTAGGNVGVVLVVHPSPDGELIRVDIHDPMGAEFQNVEAAEVLTGIVDDVEMWAAAGDWLTSALEAQATQAGQGIPVDDEFKPSGIFEVGEPCLVPLDGGRTVPGDITAKNKGGTKFTVQRRDNSEELELDFNELAAVNPSPEAAPAEEGAKRKRKPKSPAVEAAHAVGIGGEGA